MIGGYDKTYTVPRDETDIILATVWATIKKEIWPEAIIEVDLHPGPEEQTSWFIYKDRKTLLSWIKEGATDENSNDMIQILIGKDTITFVFGSRHHPSVRVVLRAVEQQLKRR